MAESFDAIISRVHGFIKASDVRCVWSDGILYVAKTPTDIAVFACDKPVKRGGTYNVSTAQGELRMQPPGCGSCRRRVQDSPVGQMTLAEIVDAVSTVDSL